MNVSFITILLWTWSALLAVLGVAQIAFDWSSVSGWASIAIGMALIVVAASTLKKTAHG